MKRRLFLSLPALLAALALSAPAAAQEEPKAVLAKITKKYKAGAEWDFKTTFRMEMTISLEGSEGAAPAEEQKQSGSLSGRLKVQEVNAKGKLTKYTIAVEEMALRPEEGGQEIALKDKELVVDATGEERKFTIGGDEADEETKDVLDALMPDDASEDDADDKTDDEVFGYDKPRKAGETWESDAQLAIDAIPAEMGMTLTKKGSVVKNAMKSVKQVDGRDLAEVQSDAKLMIKGIGALPGAKVSGSVEALFKATSSTKEDEPNLKDFMDLTITYEAEMDANGAAGKMEGRIKANQTTESTLVKP